MAERRMFSNQIIDSDAFLEMPLSTQALYFHLSMKGDDEGFVNNPKKIARMIGASEDELKLLLVKKFIIGFENGVVVIKHWKIHNYIRGDRLRSTSYTEERSLLETKDNGAYTLCQSNVSQMSVKCQHRLGKDSIGEDRLVEASIEEDIVSPKCSRFKKPTLEELQSRANEMGYRFKVEEFYNYYEANGWKVGKNKMVSWKSALANWNTRSFGYGGKKAELLDRSTNESSRSYIVANENTF